MSIRSDFCCFFAFPKEKEEEFKNLFKEYMIQIIDNSKTINIINEFYKIENNDIPENETGFCLFMESIKFDYIEPLINNLIEFLEKIKKSIKLRYEARELCTEFLTFDTDFHKMSDENQYSTLYVNCTLDGIPNTNGDKLLDWLKT